MSGLLRRCFDDYATAQNDQVSERDLLPAAAAIGLSYLPRDAYIQRMTKGTPAQIPAGQIFVHNQARAYDSPEWLPCESAARYVLCDCKFEGSNKHKHAHYRIDSSPTA